MLKIKPPTHRIDAGGVYISSLDRWDNDRIAAELKELEAQALREIQDAAAEKYLAAHSEATDAEVATVRESCKLTDDEVDAARARHPVSRYYRGKTRYQPDAPDWDPAGKPTTVRSYLTASPTEFALRRLSYRDYQLAKDETSSRKRLTQFLRLGVRAIRSPGDDLQWTAKGDETVPEEIMEAIHRDAGEFLFRELGNAVQLYNRPLSDEESFR